MSSPSRSEKILRDMLRDAPGSPPCPKHRRRHSTPVAGLSRCSQDGDETVLSPHEQVLRVRLERVLHERSHSRSGSRGRSHTHGSAPTSSMPTPPPTPPSAESSPHLPSTPVLPPTPSRQFNARTASLQCRLIDGYVSFAAIEGLGAPPEPAEEPVKEDPSWRRVLGRWVS